MSSSIGPTDPESLQHPPRRVLLIELAEDGSVGGSHRCLVDLAVHLDRRHFEPVAVFHQSNPCLAELREAGVEAHLLPSRKFSVAHERSRPKRLARKLAVIRRLIAFLRVTRADLVHLNNSPFGGTDDWMPAARWLGIPCLTHARGFPWEGAGLFDRVLARKFDRVIMISRSILEAWRQVGIPGERSIQVYDGVDLEAVRRRGLAAPGGVRRELGISPEEVLVVMVGHLRSWKGQDVLLQALGLLARGGRPSPRVLFVGGPSSSEDSSYVERLERMVVEQGLHHRVSFLGPRRDAVELLGAADIVVHASTSPEPFGLVVVEGMAMAKPVIASRLGGPGEIVQPGSGILFDPGHPDDLATHLEALMGDPAFRRKLGEGGLARAEAFDIRQNVRAIEAVYRSL